MLSGHPFVPSPSSRSLSRLRIRSTHCILLLVQFTLSCVAILLPVHPSGCILSLSVFPLSVFVRSRKNNGFSFDRPRVGSTGPAGEGEGRLNWKYVIRQCVKSSDFPADLGTLPPPSSPGQAIAPYTPAVTDVVGRNSLFLFVFLSRLQQ